MNEKLKQSLDTRLGGMRWGERDQAEVFRLARRKELQDVKHFKRGTGMLAIAVALLFVVMGAAFALTNATEPDRNQVAGQTAQPTFVPVAAIQYENEYFTLTIDSTTCTTTEAAFTGTIRMKEPEKFMLNLAGHTPPGDPTRQQISVNLTAGVTTRLPGDVPMALGTFRNVNVTDMTADTATFRMTGSVAGLNEDATFTLWIDLGEGINDQDKLTWRVDAPEQAGMLLGEYDLVTATLAEYVTDSTPDGVTSHLAIDVTPAKPWYVLNRQEADKSTLNVSAESLKLYPTFDPQDMLSMVEAREPAAAEFPVTLETTPEGLRLTAEGPLPADTEVLYGYLVLHVYSAAAEAHYESGFDDHYYEVCIPLSTVPTQTVAVSPTPTPMAFTADPASPTPSPMAFTTLPLAPTPAPTPTPAPQPVLPTPQSTESAPHRIWMLENEIYRLYYQSELIGSELHMTFHVEACQPGYIFNSFRDGATRVTLTPEIYSGYDGETALRPISYGGGTFQPTENGAQLDAVIPFPEAHDSLTLTCRFTSIAAGETKTERVSITIYRPGTYPTTPTPSPRPEATGEHIGGTDTVSVYLEESWYDGFSAEVALRIRADDPANRLAITPNLGEQPDENTWVVQLEGNWSAYYCEAITPTLTLDEATGDVLARLTYQDATPTGDDSMTFPFTMRVVNEKTWQTETEEFSIPMRPDAEYPWQPLYLADGESPETFIQAGCIITDRYTYIGVMRTYDNRYPAFRLTDGAGNVLATDSSSAAINTEIEWALFPEPYTAASQATASVVRLDGTQPLPEELRAEYYTQRGDYMMHFILTTVEADPAD